MSRRFDLGTARRLYLDSQPKHPKPVDASLQRDLERGWMVPYLLGVDALLWGRWEYWFAIHLEGALPEAPIPPLDWDLYGADGGKIGHGPGRRMLERCLESISGTWRGWSTWNEMNYLLDWLLFGFGAQDVELPQEPYGAAGASMRLYQLFDLWPLLLWPYDHWADLLAETNYGRGQGFFATPHNVVEMMVQMTMTGRDCRAETVNDPAVGSGRMLLHASNHSLRLFGQDIDATLCKVCRVNGYLFAPWLAKPFDWDEAGNIVQSEQARVWAQVLKMEALLREVFGNGHQNGHPEPPREPQLALFDDGCAPVSSHGVARSSRVPAARMPAAVQLVMEV